MPTRTALQLLATKPPSPTGLALPFGTSGLDPEPFSHSDMTFLIVHSSDRHIQATAKTGLSVMGAQTNRQEEGCNPRASSWQIESGAGESAWIDRECEEPGWAS